MKGKTEEDDDEIKKWWTVGVDFERNNCKILTQWVAIIMQ